MEERGSQGWGTLAALLLYFGLVIVAKCVFPMALGSLMHEYPAKAPRLVALLPVCIIGGKLAWGPLTDRRPVAFVAGHLLLAALLTLGAGLAGDFASFAACWLGIDFLFGGGYGAAVAVIRSGWAQKEWPLRLGLLGASSRCGSMLAFWAFGTLVARGWSPEDLHKLGSGLLFAALGVWLASTSSLKRPGSHHTGGAPAKHADAGPVVATDAETTRSMLRRVAGQRAFWALLLSRACTMCLLGSPLHLPAFLASAAQAQAKAGLWSRPLESGPQALQAAAAGASFFGAGGLVASVGGGRAYETLQSIRGGRLGLAGVSLAVMIASAMCLYSTAVAAMALVVDPLGPHGAVLARVPLRCCVFGVGFGVSLLHYVISQMLINEMAGRAHTASLTNLCDAVGFALLGPFQGAATFFGARGDWRFYSGAVAAMAVCSCSLLAPLLASSGVHAPKRG